MQQTLSIASSSKMGSEISDTAQALLSAHYARLHPNDSSSREGEGEALAKLEAAARNIDRVCLQLDNFQVASQLKQPARTLHPLGPLAFFPATVDVTDDSVWLRQETHGLSVTDELKLEDTVMPIMTQVPAQVEAKPSVAVQFKLEAPSRTLEVRYTRVPIREAQMQLQARKTRFLQQAEKLRHSQPKQLDGSEKGPTEAKDMHVLNQDQQALNEEGLPFYEPVEEITEEEATRKDKAYMQPFVPEDKELSGNKEKRKQWMEDMLSKLEEEEKGEISDKDADEEMTSARSEPSTSTPLPAEEETRVVLRTRTPSPPPSPEDEAKARTLPEIVSATRPPPVKSALKSTAARPDLFQRPSFGAAGIRHGFLNLNPSSPGAIKSSYSWEDLEKDKPPPKPAFDSGRNSRSHTPTPLSHSSPAGSGANTPSKKSVRIKSPERGSTHPEQTAGSGPTPLQRALKSSIRVKENYTQREDSGSGTAEKRHKDDVGVEEEAERIVQLLGPGVVEGHPSAPPPDVLRTMQEAHEEERRMSTPEAIAERERREEEERERERLQRLNEKPALGHSVMERSSAAKGKDKDKDKDKNKDKEMERVQGAKFSAFKAGFLNQKPPPPSKGQGPARFVPNKVDRKPGPRESLGMSALERAGLGDDELAERRVQMGLSAAVPHARPSKAYAEKIRARREGQASHDGDREDRTDTGAVELARPVEGDDEPRAGKVRFGLAAGAEDEDVDGEGVKDSIPSETLDNYLPEEIDNAREVDEEEEEPKIEGEGADTDDEDAYFDSYVAKSRRAAAESRGLDEDDVDEDDQDNDDWDVDEVDDFDDGEDDDFDYDADDLMALAPEMGGGAGLERHPELMREYEEAKAKLAAMGLHLPGGGAGRGAASGTAVMEEQGDEEDYDVDVVPLDAALEDAEYQGNTVSNEKGASRISRFKASLAQQRVNPTARSAVKSPFSTAANIEDVLNSAQNMGQSSNSAVFSMDGRTGTPNAKGGGETGGAPVMIIPQLAPVRFAKNGDLIEGQTTGPVELDGGESDEGDEKAEMVMRSRLERLEWEREHPEEARRLRDAKRAREMVAHGVAPPAVVSRRDDEKEKQKGKEGDQSMSLEAAGVEEVPAVMPKKVSRFKAARMGS